MHPVISVQTWLLLVTWVGVVHVQPFVWAQFWAIVTPPSSRCPGDSGPHPEWFWGLFGQSVWHRLAPDPVPF